MITRHGVGRNLKANGSSPCILGKILLIKILDTFTNKFAALNLAFPSILKQAERKKNGDASSDDDFDFEKARSIHTASSLNDTQADPAKGTSKVGFGFISQLGKKLSYLTSKRSLRVLTLYRYA